VLILLDFIFMRCKTCVHYELANEMFVRRQSSLFTVSIFKIFHFCIVYDKGAGVYFKFSANNFSPFSCVN